MAHIPVHTVHAKASARAGSLLVSSMHVASSQLKKDIGMVTWVQRGACARSEANANSSWNLAGSPSGTSTSARSAASPEMARDRAKHAA